MVYKVRMTLLPSSLRCGGTQYGCESTLQIVKPYTFKTHKTGALKLGSSAHTGSLGDKVDERYFPVS